MLYVCMCVEECFCLATTVLLHAVALVVVMLLMMFRVEKRRKGDNFW